MTTENLPEVPEKKTALEVYKTENGKVACPFGRFFKEI